MAVGDEMADEEEKVWDMTDKEGKKVGELRALYPDRELGKDGLPRLSDGWMLRFPKEVSDKLEKKLFGEEK